MTANESLDRLGTLAFRRGLSLGSMHGSAPGDPAMLMAAAGHAYGPPDDCGEREVNERLRAWLAGAGAMLSFDQVELRRWLVDTGVPARDGCGRAYTPGTPLRAIADAMDLLAGHDLAALVRDARAEDDTRREARKTQWTRGAGGRG